MHVLARVRMLLARRPWIYWLAVAAVAAAVGLGTARALAGIDAARLAWGQQATVWVATADIEPGQPIQAQQRQVPRAVVPTTAVGGAPSDAIARQWIAAGEIITTDDVSASGTAGLIPEGWVAFSVPSPGGQFRTGDHLRVYSGDVLVATGLVVDTGDDDLMVAIPDAAGPAMATAILGDSITVGLSASPWQG